MRGQQGFIKHMNTEKFNFDGHYITHHADSTLKIKFLGILA
jgi:hypothetical protein